MEVIKHTESSFIIKDDAKTASFTFLGLFLLLTIILLATFPTLGVITLVLTGMYVMTGYLSRTYIFDKKENTFSVTEITFFRTLKKQYSLDNIQSILFVAMFPYKLFPSDIALIGELTHHSGSVIILKTCQKVSIHPS